MSSHFYIDKWSTFDWRFNTTLLRKINFWRWSAEVTWMIVRQRSKRPERKVLSQWRNCRNVFAKRYHRLQKCYIYHGWWMQSGFGLWNVLCWKTFSSKDRLRPVSSLSGWVKRAVKNLKITLVIPKYRTV